MAAPALLSIPSLALLLSLAIIPAAVSQDPMKTGPVVGDCSKSLIMLMPCLQFVQGTVQAPPQPCCDNLRQLYDAQPQCLCLLLNDSGVGGITVNRTLAMELPTLCNFRANISSCPGVSVPPTPPGPQVGPPANKNNSFISAAPMASPTVPMSPRQGLAGKGFPSSAGSLKKKGHLAILVTLVTILLLKLLF